MKDRGSMQNLGKWAGVIITAACLLEFLSGNKIYARENGLLQFTVGKHVVGFEKSGVDVVGGSRALRIGFGGTAGVMPQTVAVTEGEGKERPFQEVRYPELWPGITLVYGPSASGVVKSTYYVSPHADIDAIRLVYNVPVEIDENGALDLPFETGTMTESAPVAWQEINGKKVPVKAAFRRIGKHEARFEVGSYDPSLPLIIDPELAWNTFHGGLFSIRRGWR